MLLKLVFPTETVIYESRHKDFTTAARDIITKRYLEIENKIYLITAIISIEPTQ